MEKKKVRKTVTFLLCRQKSKTIAASILVRGVHNCPKFKTWGRSPLTAIPIQWWVWEERCIGVNQMSTARPGEALWAWFFICSSVLSSPADHIMFSLLLSHAVSPLYLSACLCNCTVSWFDNFHLIHFCDLIPWASVQALCRSYRGACSVY